MITFEIMEKTSTLINNIYSGTTDYIRLQTRSAKLEIYERVTNLIESGISASVILLLGLFSFLFLNFGVALWLGDLMGSNRYGFFAVGGFYVVVLGLYVLLKDQVGKNKVRNMVLLKVSKTHKDYDLLLKEQTLVHSQVQTTEKMILDNIHELKENIDTLKEDFTRLKEQFVTGGGEGEDHVGPKIPRVAITSLVDVVLQKVVLKNSGLLKRVFLPIIANTLLTSKAFNESKKTSLLENLKLKFSKFL